MNDTHDTFENILASARPELRPACESLHELISSLHEGFVEVVWPKQRIASFGVGPRKMSEHYAYIAVYASHVNLGFYHGASLSDPTGLLEGTGARLRHVRLRSVAEAKNRAVAALLREAIADRKRQASRGRPGGA